MTRKKMMGTLILNEKEINSYYSKLFYLFTKDSFKTKDLCDA